MKIGFDAKRAFHNRTGLGNYSRDLIRILSAQFPQHQYYMYNPKPARSVLFEAASLSVIEKKPRGVLSGHFYNLWRQFCITADMVKDGIQVYHGLSAELPIGISKTGIPSLVTIHDLIFLRYPEFYPKIDSLIYRLKTLHAAKNADKIFAISEQTKQDLVHFLKIEPEKISVIYQGCQQVFQAPMDNETRLELIKPFQLPDAFVLYVGTIEKRKNLLALVKAIEDIDTHMVVVGSETPYAKTVREYALQRNISHKISFLKGLKPIELAALYRSARVFVYPSLFEGFGIPIVEALFSGTPVITSKGGCFGEAGGPASRYVDPMEPDEIKDAILEILNNDDLYNSMREQGLIHAQKFTDSKIGIEYMKVYESILR